MKIKYKILSAALTVTILLSGCTGDFGTGNGNHFKAKINDNNIGQIYKNKMDVESGPFYMEFNSENQYLPEKTVPYQDETYRFRMTLPEPKSIKEINGFPVYLYDESFIVIAHIHDADKEWEDIDVGEFSHKLYDAAMEKFFPDYTITDIEDLGSGQESTDRHRYRGYSRQIMTQHNGEEKEMNEMAAHLLFQSVNTEPLIVCGGIDYTDFLDISATLVNQPAIDRKGNTWSIYEPLDYEYQFFDEYNKDFESYIDEWYGAKYLSIPALGYTGLTVEDRCNLITTEISRKFLGKKYNSTHEIFQNRKQVLEESVQEYLPLYAWETYGLNPDRIKMSYEERDISDFSVFRFEGIAPAGKDNIRFTGMMAFVGEKDSVYPYIQLYTDTTSDGMCIEFFHNFVDYSLKKAKFNDLDIDPDFKI